MSQDKTIDYGASILATLNDNKPLSPAQIKWLKQNHKPTKGTK